MDLEILKIASDTKNHKVLKDSSHFAKFKNPLCGDEMNAVSYTHLRAHET